MITLIKCKDCEEQINLVENDCGMCEDCCYEEQMNWQTTESKSK
jgi:hypothetical protein